MAGIDRRIEALERIYQGEPCPECGFEAGDLLDWEVVWEDDAEAPEVDEGPEFCPGCGRQLIYTVVWGDLAP